MVFNLPGYPHQESLTSWDDIDASLVLALKRSIEAARVEGDMQSFLEQHPRLLIQHLGGGHGRWVIPKQRLGSEYVTDFVIGEKDSIGFWWTAVELESPTAKMFNKNGDPSSTLNHAIRQIQDWRAWLGMNQNYAANAREKGGLGLTDITAMIPGLILLGRRSSVSDGTGSRRRQMMTDLRIDIHTYDWLADQSEGWLQRLSPADVRQRV